MQGVTGGGSYQKKSLMFCEEGSLRNTFEKRKEARTQKGKEGAGGRPTNEAIKEVRNPLTAYTYGVHSEVSKIWKL